jgi:N-glycosylase/DNA lyase
MNINAEYNKKKENIKSKLSEFKNLKESEYFKELLFCTLTPQSNAKRCWQAVQEIIKLNNPSKDEISNILKSRVRFHNNKAKYIIENKINWDIIKDKLNNPDRVKLRNFLADSIKGFGLKEASHFLRNIGKSDNQLAILDRHILRNLKELNIIDTDKIKNNKHYMELEQKFLNFSKQTGIPADELDLLFWSNETGEIFK